MSPGKYMDYRMNVSQRATAEFRRFQKQTEEGSVLIR